MSNNRLTFKDFLKIYFIIFLLAAFIAGFFLGAKTMENQLIGTSTTKTNIDQGVYQKDEILTYYDKIYSPIRDWNLEIINVTNKNYNEKEYQALIDKGEFLKANLTLYSQESKYLIESTNHIKNNIDFNLEVLNEKKLNLLNNAHEEFLISQKYFYKNIWIWEQSLNTPNNKIITESDTTWDNWNVANLHHKNYIVASILVNDSIYTYFQPEDITVHIDAYIKTTNNPNMKLEDIIHLLVNSDSIEENDFSQYKHSYSDVIIPNLPNFN